MVAEFHLRVERAMTHILSNLDRSLTLAEVAGVAGVSPFYFHRIFTAVAGEPVGRFVTRTRLHAAAIRLAYERDRDVTEIAYACGYSSPSNFSKAFASFYGCSPSALRSPAPVQQALAQGKLYRLYGLRLHPHELYGRPDTVLPASEPRYVDTPPVPLCCLAAPTGASHAQVGQTFWQLATRARALRLDLEAGLFGARLDHSMLTAPRLRRYHCCVRCWAGFRPPPPLFAAAFPAGRYALFRVAGTASEVEAQSIQALANWSATRQATPTGMYLVEHFTRIQHPDRYDYDIWVSVRPRR